MRTKMTNKGTVVGKMTRADLIDLKNKETGQPSGRQMLAFEVTTGGNNRVRGTVFPTRNNPSKPQDYMEQYPVGTEVEAIGKVNRREYEANGRKRVDHSIQCFILHSKPEDASDKAVFIIQGLVDRIRETDGGALVTVKYIEEWESKDGRQKRETEFLLTANEKAMERMNDLDVEKDCAAKFKGYIINELEYDEFGDIIGDRQCLEIATVESVIPADELAEQEEAPDFL